MTDKAKVCNRCRREVDCTMTLSIAGGKPTNPICGKCLETLPKRLSRRRKMAKAKKPYVDVDIKCPHCNAEMEVKVYRTKVSPANPEPEYDYEKQIQLTLPGLPIAEPQEVGA